MTDLSCNGNIGLAFFSSWSHTQAVSTIWIDSTLLSQLKHI